MIEPPVVVQNKARAVGAHRWLAGLADLVAELTSEWELTLGAPYADATEAYVVRATTHDGVEAVLKILVPRGELVAHHEITVLALAGGQGCARLLRADADRGAVLLERLGPSMHDLGLPTRERHRLLCATARAIWRPAPDVDLPSGAEKAEWLARHVTTTWTELDEPCSDTAIQHALVCADRRGRAHDDERAVLLHGDVHEWNALSSPDGFKLVDPDGLLAEPEYDLGVMMREDPVELRGRPVGAGPPLRPLDGYERQGDLGMGCPRARGDRTSRDGRRPPADRPADVGGRRLDRSRARQLTGHRCLLDRASRTLGMGAPAPATRFRLERLQRGDVGAGRVEEPSPAGCGRISVGRPTESDRKRSVGRGGR